MRDWKSLAWSAPGDPRQGKLQVRIGIATGLVVVGDLVGHGAAQEQAVVGDTPNLAARLQALAEPDSVVVAAATRRLLRRQVPLARPRPACREGPGRAGRGLGGARRLCEREPVRGRACRASHRLRRARGGERHFRDRQRRAWQGEGQIVLISGEAGIGKSRLSRLARRADRGRAAYPAALPMFALSPRQRALSVRAAIRARRADRAATRPRAQARQARSRPGAGDRRAEEIAPLIAALLSIPAGNRYPPLGLSPAQQRRQTFSALLDQMEGLARQQPVLMLFEDAHWADATSLELLDLAIERCGAAGAAADNLPAGIRGAVEGPARRRRHRARPVGSWPGRERWPGE